VDGPTGEPDSALAIKDSKDLVHKKLSKHKYNEFVKQQEMNILAKELLIDLKSDPPICLNFLGLICASYLKVGWKKELHPDGTLFYAQKTRGELSKVHPEIDKIKRFYNEFLNHVTGSTNRTILPRSLLERTFGTKFTNTTAIYASFFEGDIEADMTALFDSIKEGVVEKSETEIAMLTEGMLKDAKGWYEEEFGYDYKTLRELFDEDWSWQVLNFESLKDNLSLFNIKESDSHLVWIIRMYEHLPIHVDWLSYYDEKMERTCYRHKTTLIGTRLKPAYHYVLDLIQRYQEHIFETSTKASCAERNHTFTDKFGREVKVQNNILFNIEELDLGVDAAELEKDRERRKAQNISRHPFMGKYEKFYLNPNLKDQHLFDVCDQLDIDLGDIGQVHLMGFINNYIMTNPNSVKWHYRIPTDEGNLPYWINHDIKKVSLVYPMLDDLRIRLDDYQEDLKKKMETQRQMKDTGTFRDMLGVADNNGLNEFLNEHRKPFIMNYFVGKLAYDEAMYKFHKNSETTSHFGPRGGTDSLNSTKQNMAKRMMDKTANIGAPTMELITGRKYSLKEFTKKLLPGFSRKEVLDF
jgi:hypothetical protein